MKKKVILLFIFLLFLIPSSLGFDFFEDFESSDDLIPPEGQINNTHRNCNNKSQYFTWNIEHNAFACVISLGDFLVNKTNRTKDGSEWSLYIDKGDDAGMGHIIGIAYQYNVSPIFGTFTEDTVMSFDCTSRLNSPGGHFEQNHFLFATHNETYQFYYDTNNNFGWSGLDNTCSLDNITNNKYPGELNDCFNGTTDTFNFHTFEFTALELKAVGCDLIDKEVINFSIVYERNTGGASLHQEYIDNIRITNLIENALPVFNVSLDSGVPCLNSTRGETQLNITIDSFDLENNTILYSLRADENDVFTLLDFTGEITPLNIEFCYISQALRDVTDILSFPEWARLLLDIEGLGCTSRRVGGISGSVSISNVLPEFSVFNSCGITTTVSPSFYISEQVNTRGNIVPMLYLNPFCNLTREAYLKLDVGLRNLTFATNLVINELLNNSFNITFYENPTVPSGKVIQLYFNLSDDNIMSVFNSQGAGIGLTNIITFSMDNDDNKQGFYRYLGVQLNYDFSNDIYNITFKTLNESFYYASDVRGYWNSTDLTQIIKYIGIAINQNTTLGDIFVENYYYGGFTLTITPFYSIEKPSFVEINRVGYNNLNFYVTDDVHLSTGEFVTKNIGITVVECDSPYAPLEPSATFGGFLESSSTLYNSLCSSFGTVFSVFGSFTLNMCTIIYFVYMIVCLIISLVLAFFIIRTYLSATLTFGVSGLVFSLSQLMLWRIFLYSRALIILYSMIFAVAGISLFISFFAPKSSGV